MVTRSTMLPLTLKRLMASLKVTCGLTLMETPVVPVLGWNAVTDGLTKSAPAPVVNVTAVVPAARLPELSRTSLIEMV